MSPNYEHISALRRSFDTVKKRQNDNPLPGLEDRKVRLRAAREATVGNAEVLNKAIAALEKNGMRVIMADTKEAAVAAVLKELGSESIVVKSKSNVTKEIDLTKELDKAGIDAVETDIGDRIAQIMSQKPSHPTGPIAHLSAKEITAGLKEAFGVDLAAVPDEIVRYVRDDINTKFDQAKIGITGANAITADEGSIVLVHNEGNIFKTMRKEKHIVVTGIDKIYPDLDSAINMVKIIAYNATGALVPSFVEIISGMTKTANVEKKFIPGIHNPQEIVVILVDNKRSEMVKKGFAELLYCIGCGNCLVHCPMYNTIGNDFAIDNYLGGKGLAYFAAVSDEKKDKMANCLTCGNCNINCPVDINIKGLIKKLRSDNSLEELYYFFKSHLIWSYFSLKLIAYNYNQNRK